MQNTINNRFDIPCYSFIAINPGKVAAFFRRMAIFFKATLAIKKANLLPILMSGRCSYVQ